MFAMITNCARCGAEVWCEYTREPVNCNNCDNKEDN